MSKGKVLGNSVEVMNRILEIYTDCLKHDGFADFHIEMKILKRGQKEVIIRNGKQYRFVIDMPTDSEDVFQGFQLVADAEVDSLKKGQAKSFSLARPVF